MEEYFNGLLKEVDQRMATTASGMDGKEVIASAVRWSRT